MGFPVGGGCKPEGWLAPSQGSLLSEFHISPSRQLRQQWILQQACVHKTREEGESLTADGKGTQEVKGCILTLKTNNGAVLCPFFICFILRQRLAEVPGWPFPASASQVLQVGVQKPSGPFEEREIHHAR